MTATTAFTALVLRQQDEQISAAFETVNDDALPAGDVTVRVAYSTVNYKDGMVLGGLGRLVRDYPHIPGIDFSGVVEADDQDLEFRALEEYLPEAVDEREHRADDVCAGRREGCALLRAGCSVTRPRIPSLLYTVHSWWHPRRSPLLFSPKPSRAHD